MKLDNEIRILENMKLFVDGVHTNSSLAVTTKVS